MSDIDKIFKVLSSKKISLLNEKKTQDEIENLFINNSIPYKREYKLSDNDIIDFLLYDNIGVEVKIKAPARTIFRQCKRYCEHDEISKIILVSGKHMGLPEQINNKDCYFFSLSRSWML